MKKISGFAGLLLIMYLAGNTSLNAQRGMRGMMMDSDRRHRMDTININRMRMNIHPDSTYDRFVRQGMGSMRNSPIWQGRMRGAMGPMWRSPMGRGMGPLWNPPRGNDPGPMWRGQRGGGMGPMWMHPAERRMSPVWRGPAGRGMDSSMISIMRNVPWERGDHLMERIPNITEKQKAQLEELRERNQAEMKKFREETAAKMKSIRENQREKILDLLTPEQKKWIESNKPGFQN